MGRDKRTLEMNICICISCGINLYLAIAVLLLLLWHFYNTTVANSLKDTSDFLCCSRGEVLNWRRLFFFLFLRVRNGHSQKYIVRNLTVTLQDYSSASVQDILI